VAQTLGRLHDHRVVEPLIALLQFHSNEAAEDYAQPLDQLHDHRVAKPLMASLEYLWRRYLKRGNWRARRVAAAVPGQRADVPKDPNVSVRAAAANGLGELGDTRAVEPLIAALKDSASDVQSSAVRALAKLGDARAVEPVTEIINRRINAPADYSPSVNDAAGDGLLKLGYALKNAGDTRASAEAFIGCLDHLRGYDHQVYGTSLSG
jgi:HEAT repeat protein